MMSATMAWFMPGDFDAIVWAGFESRRARDIAALVSIVA
jgi:hypothetical protein